jgi:hypothetical protein
MDRRFCPSEATFEYWTCVRHSLGRDGRPAGSYSDNATVLRLNIAVDHGRSGNSRFGRVVRKLNIDVGCADSPAATESVDRAHLPS